jgi:hypothetical protein
MVRVYITRYIAESDPLQVIADATMQATAEREAKRIGLASEYLQTGEFVELHITGEASEPMRDFLTTLRGFSIAERTIDVETQDEEAELGESADGHNVCIFGKPLAEPHGHGRSQLVRKRLCPRTALRGRRPGRL